MTSRNNKTESVLSKLAGHLTAAQLWALARDLQQDWHPDYLTPLLRILSGSDSGFDEQSAAAALLGASGDERAVAPLLAKLEDAHPSHAAIIATALGRLQASEAEPVLARLARDTSRLPTRVAAIRALAGIASTQTLRRLEAEFAADQRASNQPPQSDC